ncbi:Beta-1,3-galactosyl-O-glycosyl-glycoprotein beta-1,6-N-acetylglucosaminyltransferase 3 [Aphelenchoides bicaudatus]|nr:Beta-1,3-galactosyl-O-glycosyl-glycoprotein beta-1,6-N-acetylglucosaminyltransferase 3 [Aphelenchoides bicaudatus]
MNERNLKFILKVGMYFLPITSKQRMFTRTRRSTTYSLTRSLARTKMPKLFAGFVVIIFIHFLIIIFLLSYRDPFTFTEILSAKFFRPPRFHKPNITAHVPCHKFFDPEYDRFYLAKKYRITYKESENKEEWPTDCGSIRSRNFFANKPMSEEERNFSIAYARNVYRDYRFLEMTLATTYAPSKLLLLLCRWESKKRMNDLASCLPNVHVTDFAAVMDSFGHNTNSHHMECLKWLAHKNRKWKYVMLLQNFDVPLKTNQEMVQILNWYNGSNDVTTQYRLNWPHNNTWTFNAIKLFKDPARNNLTVNGDPPFFFFSRSPVEVTMSREAIDFILEKMDLRGVIAQFNSYPVTAIDEFVTSSNKQ